MENTFKKIIPCLDVFNGRVVKGVNFVDFTDAGDPSEYAVKYCNQGADELVFLDISATAEGRANTISAIKDTIKSLTVPLTVGGGIRTLDDMQKLFDAGVSKVSVNSAAVATPELIASAAKKFGSGKIVVAVDVKKHGNVYMVVTHGGKTVTQLSALNWCKQCRDLGAGEILLTSMDADGTKDGFDIEITAAVSSAVSIPVTASGGCGSLEHFYTVFEKTNAASALAASLFHFDINTVGDVKDYLDKKGIAVRK